MLVMKPKNDKSKTSGKTLLKTTTTMELLPVPFFTSEKFYSSPNAHPEKEIIFHILYVQYLFYYLSFVDILSDHVKKSVMELILYHL